MLCPCTTNPLLSAYEALEGMFSLDRTQMALIGTKIMIHVKTSRCQTWGYHAIRAWYYAPALTHYQCIKAVTESGAVRITDTLKFLHHCLPDPAISNTDHILLNNYAAIQGQPDAPLDELQAIQQLRDLITGLAKHKLVTRPEIDLDQEQKQVSDKPA
ncbi:LOW QUALITY PROTEIN: hypothetical protein ACHAW6_009156 [Cyclotella cf. meneghiniana]